MNIHWLKHTQICISNAFLGLMFDRRGSMSSCSHYSDSRVSSESLSPYHISRALHSDSDLTPKKQATDCSSSNKLDHHQWAHLDIDDLPPKLQRLIASAFENIGNGENSEETLIQSPSRHPSPVKTVATDDVKCWWGKLLWA